MQGRGGGIQEKQQRIEETQKYFTKEKCSLGLVIDHRPKSLLGSNMHRRRFPFLQKAFLGIGILGYKRLSHP